MIRLIVAFTEDHIIAKNGELPVHLGADLQHFKETTKGRPVVMGRKTFDSIGRPLPDRRNIVLTRKSRPIDGAYVMNGIESVFSFFGSNFDVIGGAEVYQTFLELGVVDELIVTHIHTTVTEGVLTRFPIEAIECYEAAETLFTQDKDDNNDAAFTVVRYVRKSQ